MAATVVCRVMVVPFRHLTAGNASVLIPTNPITPMTRTARDAPNQPSRAMVTVMTRTTMLVVITMAATVVCRVMAVPFRHFTARNASVLIPTNPTRDAANRPTRTMETVMTRTTMLVVIMTAATVVCQVMAVLFKHLIARNASVLIPTNPMTPMTRTAWDAANQPSRTMVTVMTRTTMLVVTTMAATVVCRVMTVPFRHVTA